MAHIAGSQPVASTSTGGSGGGAVITAPPAPGAIVQATAGPSSQETTAMDFQDILEDRHGDSAIMDEGLSQGMPSECPYSNWSLNLKRRMKKKLARGEQVRVAGRVISPASPSSTTALSSTSYAAASAGASKKPSFKKRRRLPPPAT